MAKPSQCLSVLTLAIWTSIYIPQLLWPIL